MKATRSGSRPVDLERRLFAIADELRGLGSAAETAQIILALIALRKVLKVVDAGDAGTLADLAHALDLRLALENSLDRLRANKSDVAMVVDAIDTLLSGSNIDRRALAPAIQGVAGLPDELLDPSSLARAATALVAQAAVRKGELGSCAPGLTKLMVDLVAPPSGARCADPFCRAGLLLLSTGLRARERGAPVAALGGTDPNRVAAAMAKCTLFVADLPNDIDVANVLLSPGKQSLARYDAVLTAPPFGLPSPPHLHIEGSERFRFGVPARAADWLFAQHALALLSDDGVAVVLMSRGPLFRTGGEEEVRRRLLEADRIDCVIGLPAGLLTGTNIPCALIVLRAARPKERRGRVRLVEVEELARAARRSDLTDELIASVLTATKGSDRVDAGVRVRDVPVEELATNDYSLLPSRYFEPTPVDELRDLDVIAAELRQALDAERAATGHVATSLAALAEATRGLLPKGVAS